MTCGEKLWSFRTPFCHSDTIVFDGTQRQIMVILHLLSSRGGGPDDMRRRVVVIPHTFSPFKHNRVRWHAETNIVFYAFCHPEAAGPMTCRDKLWSFRALFHLLSSRGGGLDDMREPLGPTLFHLLSSRDGGPDGLRGSI